MISESLVLFCPGSANLQDTLERLHRKTYTLYCDRQMREPCSVDKHVEVSEKQEYVWKNEKLETFEALSKQEFEDTLPTSRLG